VRHYPNGEHRPTPHWKLVPDTTINFQNARASLMGIELVSPILVGEEGLDRVSSMIKAVGECGGKVNMSSGHHVHIDASEMSLLEIKKVIVAFLCYEKVFDLMTTRSRQTNQWSASNQEVLVARSGGSLQGAIQRVKAAANKEELVVMVNPANNYDGWSRYYKMNITNLSGGNGHNTIEFRMHQGTHNAQKTRNWIEMLQRFVHTATAKEEFVVPPPTETPAQLWLHMMHKMVNKAGLTKWCWNRILEMDTAPPEPRIVRVSTAERRAVEEGGGGADALRRAFKVW